MPDITTQKLSVNSNGRVISDSNDSYGIRILVPGSTPKKQNNKYYFYTKTGKMALVSESTINILI